MQEILAEVNNLKLNYSTSTAVQDVSFKLYRGEILAIIGPNGSGKTSVVECVEGLRRPTSGTVTVFGKNPYLHRHSLYKKTGVQLQDTQYPEKIKVGEVCRLFSSFYDHPADWKELARQLGLWEKQKRTVKKLSGGERQRLSILLALLPRPELLILDELTTGLDPEIRRGVWDSLLNIKKLGTTILLVSHYMDEVEYLADRLVYFTQGRSLFEGFQDDFREYARTQTPENLWRKNLTLEQVYLLLSPQANTLELEGIL